MAAIGTVHVSFVDHDPLVAVTVVCAAAVCAVCMDVPSGLSRFDVARLVPLADLRRNDPARSVPVMNAMRAVPMAPVKRYDAVPVPIMVVAIVRAHVRNVCANRS